MDRAEKKLTYDILPEPMFGSGERMQVTGGSQFSCAHLPRHPDSPAVLSLDAHGVAEDVGHFLIPLHVVCIRILTPRQQPARGES